MGKKKKRKPRGPHQTQRSGLSDLALARARRYASFSAVGLLLGIALTATGEITFGPWLSVLSLALAIGAAHTLGRCGPDPGSSPISRETR